MTFGWIIDIRRTGVIKAKATEPRSYIVETDKSTIRRNRFHLVPLKGRDEMDYDIWDTEVPTDETNNEQPETAENTAEENGPVPTAPMIPEGLDQHEDDGPKTS